MSPIYPNSRPSPSPTSPRETKEARKYREFSGKKVWPGITAQDREWIRREIAKDMANAKKKKDGELEIPKHYNLAAVPSVSSLEAITPYIPKESHNKRGMKTTPKGQVFLSLHCESSDEDDDDDDDDWRARLVKNVREGSDQPIENYGESYDFLSDNDSKVEAAEVGTTARKPTPLMRSPTPDVRKPKLNSPKKTAGVRKPTRNTSNNASAQAKKKRQEFKMSKNSTVAKGKEDNRWKHLTERGLLKILQEEKMAKEQKHEEVNAHPPSDEDPIQMGTRKRRIRDGDDTDDNPMSMGTRKKRAREEDDDDDFDLVPVKKSRLQMKATVKTSSPVPKSKRVAEPRRISKYKKGKALDMENIDTDPEDDGADIFTPGTPLTDPSHPGYIHPNRPYINLAPLWALKYERRIGEWSWNECKALQYVLKEIRDEEVARNVPKDQVLKDLGLFGEAARRIQAFGVNRVPGGCKSFWNRYGRPVTKADERANPTSQLATSQQ